MRGTTANLFLLCVLGIACAGPSDDRASTSAATAGSASIADAGVVDHHVHILGPDVMRDWKSVGVTFSRPDSIYQSAASLLVARGDSLAAITLVPMSHLYANPEFVGALAIDSLEVRRRVRRENTWVAAEAARYPGRASSLCSVPALASWAVEELAWCRDSLNMAGIKLHLASSQVDLRERAHLDRVAAIAAFASAERLPILIHVDPQRRGHDSTHIRAFADVVLAPNPELTVVIAHLGGSGGYGPWTRTVHRALRTWVRDVERDGPSRRVYFELSAVALEQESEEYHRSRRTKPGSCGMTCAARGWNVWCSVRTIRCSIRWQACVPFPRRSGLRRPRCCRSCGAGLMVVRDDEGRPLLRRRRGASSASRRYCTMTVSTVPTSKSWECATSRVPSGDGTNRGHRVRPVRSSAVSAAASRSARSSPSFQRGV